MHGKSIEQHFLGFFRSHHFAIPLLGLLLGFALFWWDNEFYFAFIYGLLGSAVVGYSRALWVYKRVIRKGEDFARLGHGNHLGLWRWCIVFSVNILFGYRFFSPQLPSEKESNWIAECGNFVYVDCVDSVKNTARINGVHWVRVNRMERNSLPWEGPNNGLLLPRSVLHAFERSGIPEDVDWPTVFGSMGFIGRLNWPNALDSVYRIGNSTSVWGRFISWKLWCLDAMYKAFSSRLEHASVGMSMALVTGFTKGVDEQTVAAFGVGGLMHVLAVSGMHVALVMGSLMWLCTGFGSRRKPHGTVLILLLAIGWFYVVLTGGSAAVVRAMLSATWLWLGKYGIEKNVASLHVWSGCAYLQLLMGPYNALNVGFLLSNVAVLALLLLYPLLRDWLLGFSPQGWSRVQGFRSNISLGIGSIRLDLGMVLHKFWLLVYRYLLDGIAMNISATAFTFPLVVMTFGAFPVWFLPVNLLLVPMYSLLLYLALLVLLLGWIPVLGSQFSLLVSLVFSWTNTLVLKVLELPMSQWFSSDWDKLSVGMVFMGLLVLHVWVWLRIRFYRSLSWKMGVFWMYTSVFLFVFSGIEMEVMRRVRATQGCYFRGELRGRRFWGIKTGEAVVISVYPRLKKRHEGGNFTKNMEHPIENKLPKNYAGGYARKARTFSSDSTWRHNRASWEGLLRKRMVKFSQKWGVNRVSVRWPIDP